MTNKPLEADLPSAAEVAAYLRHNPDFFQHNPHLLEILDLAHGSDGAVSLLERQIGVLRQRNKETRARIDSLVETARENDKLFEKTQRLVLRLIEAQTLEGVVNALYHSLEKDFAVEYFSLTLIGDHDIPKSKARTATLEQAWGQIHTLMHSNRAICGVIRPEEMAFLFGADAGKVGSIAAVPLRKSVTWGMLAIGSSNPHRYRSSMGTLFLNYLAEVLNRVTPKYLGV